jgi:hydroxymethylpyrimidine/phosphomethylpyrimidine kinase
LKAAVGEAKDYVRRAIETAEELGHGHGPMNHLFKR